VLLGSSRQLVIGTEGSISTLVAAAILSLAIAGSPDAARGLGLTISVNRRDRTRGLPESRRSHATTVTFADVVDDAGRVLELNRVLATTRAGGP
jgi:hypothetical protein